MSSYYDTKNDETIVIGDGYAIVYDKEGFSKNIISVKDDDVSSLIEMLESNDERYEAFRNDPLT
tara:strand:+ start:412 stop:603 length:192 start_codon:yes stop_codon:yes gene_type:complete